jgi:FkbM family methyltransferase
MNFIIVILDFFYQKKKYKFLKKKVSGNIDIFIDIGSHHGKTINEFLEIFSIKKIYAFEPSEKNFHKLKKNIEKIQKTKSVEIKIHQLGVGKKEEVLQLKEITDGVSNTFSKIDINSAYFKKKQTITTLFGMKNYFTNEISTKIIPLNNLIKQEKIKKIDFIKIDTEGFEFNVLLGLADDIKKVKFILFEHHYDNMLIKEYKFSDIHGLLHKSGFKQTFKIKMPFRKSFDYIYENKNF